MRKALSGVCLLFVFVLPALAQTATIRGFVTSADDGQPLPGVNVVLISESGELFGGATDTDGFYSVSRVPAAAYVLRVTYIGFEPIEEPITLDEGVLTRNIELSVSTEVLDEVVVESDRETAGAANISAGLQTVRPADIALVPAPDISADLVNYLTALPGVVSQGDRGGQLFIRGGEPTQNLVLLDGMMIYQPFHVIGFFSAFPSDIINTADVYAGGFGSEFGGRLSSVIDVTARTGNKQRFEGAGTAAPFVSSLRLEGPIVPGRVSFLASVRQSVIEQGASRLIDEPLPFSFGDAFAKIHANISESGQISFTGLRTTDTGRLGINPVGQDGVELPQDEVNWDNLALGTRIFFLPTAQPVFAEVMLNYTKLENTFGPEGFPTRSTRATTFGFQSNVTHYIGATDVNWGIFLNSYGLEARLSGLFQNVDLERQFLTEVGAYIEPEFNVGGLSIRPGIRLQTFPSNGDVFFEPRFRSVWNSPGQMHRISVAGGVYHQEITGLNDRRDAGDIFTAWTASPFGKIPRAEHAILGYRLQAVDGLSLSIEGFHKTLENIAVPEWSAYPRFTTNLQSADGSARGLDLRMEVQPASWFQMVVSWGRSNVRYESTARALQILTGDPETEYSPPHDRKDQLAVLSSVTVKDFNLNVRWQFGSGLPFNESLGFDRFVLLDSLVNVAETPGEER
ncbi:MAG: TonB-dependent receptor plug domain-containing protein, partial [Rhodothermales bacterium]|nr:TonB-dependent receptor plug domain-containing protein [Rhodothermales bacterium]